MFGILCRSVGFVLTIMVFTTEEKVFIVEHYFRSYGVGRQNGPNLRHVREHYDEQFNKTAPTNKTILAIVEKFHCTRSVLCQVKGTAGRPRTVTTNENHERLLPQVLQSPKRSLRWTSLKLGVSDRSVRRVFKELPGFAYRIQIPQRLTETEERARVQYCSRVLSMTYTDPDFFSNIWFSDESLIHLNDYINRQTTRFLGFERPDIVVQKPQHTARITIFIAPSMRDLKHFFCRARNLPLRWEWIQQDGATAHIAGESHVRLQQHFDCRLISRGTEFPFPSHFPDVTAQDAYIWGMLKESVFRSDDPPGNVPELREKIQSFLVSFQ